MKINKELEGVSPADIIEKIEPMLPEGYGVTLIVTEPKSKDSFAVCNFCAACLWEVLQSLCLNMIVNGSSTRHGYTLHGEKISELNKKELN